MRHRDPKLTANLYTDVTRLPTFEAVKSLNWHDKRERKNQPHDTHIDPQNPDTEGLPQSRTDKQSADDTDMESDDSAPDSPNLARPETGGQKVEVAGVEPDLPVHFISPDFIYRWMIALYGILVLRQNAIKCIKILLVLQIICKSSSLSRYLTLSYTLGSSEL